MKEFDFVRLTLWIAVILTAALGGFYLFLGMQITKLDIDLALIEKTAKDVGRISKDVRTLETEKKNDKTPDSTDIGIHSYFAEQAARSQMDPNEDYTLRPRQTEKARNGGYTDTPFVLDFKKDRYKSREQIMKFIYNVEALSRRIKLSKAKITLVEDKATDDLWVPDSLTFTRRDPDKVPAAAQ